MTAGRSSSSPPRATREEAPADPGPTLARLRDAQRALEDALVPIMTGVVQLFRWME